MADRELIRRAYDEIADVYADSRSDNESEKEILKRLLEQLDSNADVLDVGCGQGTPVLQQLVDSTTALGIDISRTQLQLAEKNCPTADILHGDMTRLPLRDRHFDAITAYHSLIHVPHDHHQMVIDEFARVLRPQGWVLLSEGEMNWSGSNPDWLESGVEMQWEMAGAKATKDQLRAAGFTVVRTWSVGDKLAGEDNAQKPFFLAQYGDGS